MAKALLELEVDVRMRIPALHDRVVGTMEDVVKFTLLMRNVALPLVERYGERKQSAAEPSQRGDHAPNR